MWDTQCPSINTDESNRNATEQTIIDSKIQNNKIKATNIERCNGNEVITENEVYKNKQETNIIEESLIINAIIEPFIKINEIKIADEPKVNNIIIKNHQNINEINFIVLNEIFINNHEIQNIEK